MIHEDLDEINEMKKGERTRGESKARMAGLGLFDQKSAIAVTMPIATAFKFCIRHRKNGIANRKELGSGVFD